MKNYQLIVNGMNCGHCVTLLKKELLKIPNIKINDVRIGTAVVELEESHAICGMLTKAVEKAGYNVVSIQ